MRRTPVFPPCNFQHINNHYNLHFTDLSHEVTNKEKPYRVQLYSGLVIEKSFSGQNKSRYINVFRRQKKLYNFLRVYRVDRTLTYIVTIIWHTKDTMCLNYRKSIFLIKKKTIKSFFLFTYRDSTFFEIQSHCKGFPHEDIGIVAGHKRPFKFFQLPAVEIGAASSSLWRGALRIRFIAAACPSWKPQNTELLITCYACHHLLKINFIDHSINPYKTNVIDK